MAPKRGIEGNKQTRGPLTPEQYLADLPVTRKLKQLGLSDRQLEHVRFAEQRVGHSVQGWRIERADDWPLGALHLRRPFCTLKWLVLENPPSSEDKELAWEYVTETIGTSLIVSSKNSESGRYPRPRESAEREAVVKLLKQNPEMSEKEIQRTLDDNEVPYKVIGFKDRVSRLRGDLKNSR